MKTGGWIMLSLMWGGIITLLIYCFSKVFAGKKESDL
jgi:hypothetical protein